MFHSILHSEPRMIILEYKLECHQSAQKNPSKPFSPQMSISLLNVAYKPYALCSLATSTLSFPTILSAFFFQPHLPHLPFLEHSEHALYY